MPIRRPQVPEQPVFITQATKDRRPLFQQAAANPVSEQWLATLRAVKALHPFVMHAYVLPPDHWHLLITPLENATVSKIMHSLKRNFTQAYWASLGGPSQGAILQKGFYDHVIRDDSDFQRHLDYIHANPVRHGLTSAALNWPYSSFREWNARGHYPEDLALPLDTWLEWAETHLEDGRASTSPRDEVDAVQLGGDNAS